MKEHVAPHFVPVNFGGKEKNVDVWLVLEAFDMAILRRVEVVALIAGDGNYIPLVRKLKALGVRVLVFGWSVVYSVSGGERKSTRPSQLLVNEASYSVAMAEVIDRMDNAQGDEREALNTLFQPRKSAPQLVGDEGENAWKTGTITSVVDGYGFIKPESGHDNLFFYSTSLLDTDFDDVYRGMKVCYVEGIGQKGPAAVKVRAC